VKHPPHLDLDKLDQRNGRTTGSPRNPSLTDDSASLLRSPATSHPRRSSSPIPRRTPPTPQSGTSTGHSIPAGRARRDPSHPDTSLTCARSAHPPRQSSPCRPEGAHARRAHTAGRACRDPSVSRETPSLHALISTSSIGETHAPRADPACARPPATPPHSPALPARNLLVNRARRDPPAPQQTIGRTHGQRRPPAELVKTPRVRSPLVELVETHPSHVKHLHCMP